MATVFYILGSIAAIALIVAVPILTVRMLVLMGRMEDTRRDLSTLIAESTLTLQHANRVLGRLQDGVDHLRRTVEHLEKVLSFLQPASAVGGIIAGARRVFSGQRQSEAEQTPSDTGPHTTPSGKERK